MTTTCGIFDMVGSLEGDGQAEGLPWVDRGVDRVFGFLMRLVLLLCPLDAWELSERSFRIRGVLGTLER